MLRQTFFYLVASALTVRALNCSLPIDTTAATCGEAAGYRCDVNTCCSKYGYCGTTSQHCDLTAGCQSDFGACGKSPAKCDGVAPPPKPAPAAKCPKTKSLIANYKATWIDSPLPLYSDLTFYFTAVTSAKGFTLDAPSQKALPAFVKAARAKGSKPLITIGGWTGSIYFSSLVSTPAARKSFASQIAKYLNTYKLDGVDLDWEYPGQQGVGCNRVNAKDTDNYLLFLKELRSAVKTKLITAAVPILGFTGSDGRPLADASGFAKYFDYLTVMAYDVYGSWSETTGPVAPLYSTCSVQKASVQDGIAYWTNAGFPACRLLLGIPAYAYSWTTLSSTLAATGSGHQKSYFYQAKSSVTPKGDASDIKGSGGTDVCGNKSAGGSYAGTWTYDSLVSGGILSKDGKTGLNGFKRYYDTCSETPFLFNSKKKYFITYEDNQSVAKKAAFAKSKNLAGVAIFHSKGFPSSIYKTLKKGL